MRRVLAILLTLAPFVAGLIAALSVRRDVRMLWMAAAATLIARLVLGRMPTREHWRAAVGLAFGAASVAGIVVALLFGARALSGIAAVAVVLAGFATAGAALKHTTRGIR